MIPTAIGPYRVLEEVARGGAGVVLRAHDPAAGREVALKVLLAAGSSASRARFRREAHVLARLSHPHVVSVHAAGEHEGRPYLVLDYVRGRSLAERLRRGGPLDPDDALALGVKLAGALEHAHGLGVLHRDLKPDNVLIDEAGEPRLTDFGLAKQLEDATQRLSQSGFLLGTPGFWPPEQARGELTRIGPASDVYGLGATLYACLTGEPPCRGANLAEHVIAALEQRPTPPSRLRPVMDRDLERIVLRCLEKEPAQRYPSMAALGAALSALAAGQRGEGRRPAWLAPALAVALGGLALAALALLLPRPPRAAEVAPQPTPAATKAPLPARTPTASATPTSARAARADRRRRERAARLASQGRFGQGVGNLREAARLYDQALELDPECATALIGRGELYYSDRLDDKDVARAEELLRRGVALAPGDARGLVLLGNLLRRTERSAEAIQVLTRACELAPDNHDVWRRRGDAYQAQQDWDRAVADYERSLACEIVDPAIHRKVRLILRALRQRQAPPE